MIPGLILKQIFWNPYIFWGLSQNVPFSLKYPALVSLLLISTFTLIGVILVAIWAAREKAKAYLLIFTYIVMLWITIPFLRSYTSWHYIAPIQHLWMAFASVALCWMADKFRLLNIRYLTGVFLVCVVLIAYSHHTIFNHFKTEGIFRAPWTTLMSIIDLRRPFALGQEQTEIISLGVLEEEKLGKWAAATSEIEKYHGAILYELSISRNSLSRMFHPSDRKRNNLDADFHYVGILEKDLERFTHNPNIVYKTGAMAILKTVPIIDYSTVRMSYAEEDGWFSPSFKDRHWTPLTLPIYTVHDPVRYPPVEKDRWKRNIVFVRINIDSDRDNKPICLGVGFPTFNPIFSSNERIESVYLDGLEITHFHETGCGWIIPLPPNILRGGKSLVGLKIALNKTSNLDIYTWQTK